MSKLLRQRWGLNRPPSGPFTINHASPQSIGLVAWWPTLGSQGTTVLRDLAGAYDADLAAGAARPTWILDPTVGWILSYDGGDYVDTNTETVGSTGLFCQAAESFSVSVWHVIGGASTGTVVARGVAAIANRTFQIFFAGPANSTPTVVLRGSVNNTNAGLRDGTLHLSTVTWDGIVARYYADGRFHSNLNVGAAAENAGQRIIIGARTNGAAYYLTGSIGPVRIYDRALIDTTNWQLYDPATRWELYKPTRRLWQVKAPAAIGIFPPVPGAIHRLRKFPHLRM